MRQIKSLSVQGFANLCMFVIPWIYVPVASKLGALLLRQSRHDGAFHLMELHKRAQWFVQSLHAFFYLSFYKTILLLVRSRPEGYGYGVPPGCNLPAQPPEPSASRSEVLPHPDWLQYNLPNPFCGIVSQQLPVQIHLYRQLPLLYKPPSARFYEKRHA